MLFKRQSVPRQKTFPVITKHCVMTHRRKGVPPAFKALHGNVYYSTLVPIRSVVTKSLSSRLMVVISFVNDPLGFYCLAFSNQNFISFRLLIFKLLLCTKYKLSCLKICVHYFEIRAQNVSI
jgi:hypothetical protein